MPVSRDGRRQDCVALERKRLRVERVARQARRRGGDARGARRRQLGDERLRAGGARRPHDSSLASSTSGASTTSTNSPRVAIRIRGEPAGASASVMRAIVSNFFVISRATTSDAVAAERCAEMRRPSRGRDAAPRR